MNLDAKQEKENLWLVTKMCNFLDDYANAKRASCMSVYSYLCSEVAAFLQTAGARYI